MRKILVVIIFLFLNLSSYCYEVKVKGTVVNSDLKGISSANVCLCKINGAVLSSILTDDKGYFELNAEMSKEKVLLDISHLAYLHKSYIITKDTVLTIFLNDKSYETNEVIVRGKKRAIEFKNGNIVANVSAITNSSMSNAAKLLSKLPGVTASQKEGLSLNGVNATLYIDGRKQYIPAASLVKMLEALPTASLDQVELKSNSDGTDDASSNGAIINLITKKKRSDGYFVNIGSEGSCDTKSRIIDGGTNIFYMFKEKNIFFNTSFSYKHDYWWSIKNDSTKYQNGSIMKNNSDKYGRVNTYIGSANLAWNIKNGHVLNFNAFIYDDFSRTSKLEPIEFMFSQNDRTYINSAKGNGNDDLWSGNIEYSSPDSLNSKLTASYGIIYGGLRDKINHYSQESTDEKKKMYLYTNPEMVGYRHTGKLDYTHSFAGLDLKLLSGLKMDLGSINDDVLNREENSKNHYPNSHFNGEENIYAIYAAGIMNLTKEVGIYASVRAEHTEYIMNLKSSNVRTEDAYTNYFPYFHIYYNPTKNYQTKLAYSSGITRPNYEHMLPGVRSYNDYSYSIGNPNLKPTVSRGFYWTNYFFRYAYVFLSYMHIKDLEGQVLVSGIDNKRKYVYMNYADKQKFTTSIYIPFQFFNKKFSGNITSNIEYNLLSNPKNEYLIPIGRDKSWKWNCKMTANYEIINNLGINTWIGYFPSYKTPQYDFKSKWGIDLGLSYTTLKDENLSIAFQFENIFNTFNNRYIYYYDKHVFYNNNRFSNRFIKLSISYKLNGGSKIKDKSRKHVNDINRFKR